MIYVLHEAKIAMLIKKSPGVDNWIQDVKGLL